VVPARKGLVLRGIAFRLMGGRGARQIVRMVFSPQPVPAGAAEAFAFMLRNFRARTGRLPLFGDAELRAVSMPTLLIRGHRGALVNVAGVQQRLSELLPQFTAAIVPGAGHALSGTAARAVDFLTAGAEDRDRRAAPATS